MEQSQQPVDRETQQQRQGRGYLATILGANVGFIIGAIPSFIWSFSTFIWGVRGSDDLLARLGLALLALIIPLVIGAIGGLLGAYVALKGKGYDRKKQTLLYMALLYPISLIFLGADFLLSALIVPAIARFLALKF